ncbi:MAG: hypothetical protein A2Y14_04045 [Verrucomicrobia bacterium GWF2_51_19]|nr:MAG: hypothetical protein A2Y14_04045 [Verrucomicrobia bacterium GWF2_51_19]HCJ11540.1 hypothetical protein [Opitutae bacterium]
MKKFIKIISVLLVILGLAIAVISTSAFQTFAARTWLKRTAFNGTVERVHVGLSTVEIRGLSLQVEGCRISLDTLEGRWSALRLLLDEVVYFDSLSVKDLHVDTRQAAFFKPHLSAWTPRPSVSMAGYSLPSSFDGILSHLEKTFPIQIRTAQGNATVLLPDDHEVIFDLAVEDHAAELRIDGLLNGNVTYKGTADRPVSAAHFQSNIQLSRDAAGVPQKLQTETLLDIDGPQIPQGAGQLQLTAQITKNAANEAFSLQLESRRNSESMHLASIQGVFDATTQQISADGVFDIDRHELQDFFFGMPVPDFSFRGNASVVWSLADKHLTFQVPFSLKMADISCFDAKYKSLGAVSIKGSIKGSLDKGHLLEWNDGTLNIGIRGSEEQVAMIVQQPIHIDLAKEPFLIEKASGDLLHIRVKKLDLNTINPWLPDAFSIQQGTLSFNAVVRQDPNLLCAVEFVEPISLESVNIMERGQPFLSNIQGTLGLKLECKQDRIDYTYHFESANKSSLLLDQERFLITDKGHGYLALKDGQLNRVMAKGQARLFLKAIGEHPVVQNKTGLTLPDVNGQIDYECDFLPPSTLVCQKLDVELQTQKTSVLSIQALHPLIFNFQEINVDNWYEKFSGDLIHVKVNQFPLSLLSGLVSQKMEGTLDKGQWTLSSDKKALMLNGEQPLAIRGLAWKDLVKDANINCLSKIAINADKLSFDIDPFEFFDEKGATFSLDTDGTVDLKTHRPQGNIDLKVNALGAFLRNFPWIQTTLDGSFQLTGAVNKNAFEFKTAAHFLDNKEAKMIAIEAQGDGHYSDKEVSLRMPVKMNSWNGDSDLLLKAEVSLEDSRRCFDIDIDSQRLSVDEAVLLAAIPFALPKTTPATDELMPPQTSTPVAGQPQTKAPNAFWSQWKGKLSADIGRLIYKGMPVLTAFKAKLDVDADTLTLKPLQGTFLEAPFAVEASFGFKQSDLPYTFHGEMVWNDIRMDSVYKHFLASSPIFTGSVTCIANVSSSGIDLNDLSNNAHGNFKLTAKSGKITPLVNMNAGQQIGIGLLSTAGSILGNVFKPLGGLGDVVSYFKEIPYDNIRLDLNRDPGSDLVLKNITLEGPELYLQGTGKVVHQPKVPLLDQPLHVDARLDAKGEGAKVFSGLGILESAKNRYDYYIGPKFTLTGTINNPDYSSLLSVFKNGNKPDFLNPNKKGLLDDATGTPEKALKKTVEGIMNLFK